MKRPTGFTLVELIVAMGIMVLITTAAVANLRGRSPDRQLRDQARNLASLLRQAQVQAIAGEPADGAVPVGGYGVQAQSCSTPPCDVILFADKNGNFSLDTGEERSRISLGNDVTINSISIADPVHVLFRPPAGFICFNNVCSGALTADIVLGVRGSTTTSTVSVQQLSGQISSS